MIFMIIEEVRDIKLLRERFKRHGRMLPDNVQYQASWIDAATNRCYQVMEAPDAEALMPWIKISLICKSFRCLPRKISGQSSNPKIFASRTSGEETGLRPANLSTLSCECSSAFRFCCRAVRVGGGAICDFAGESRTPSGPSDDGDSAWHGLARVATSGVECALSGARFLTIHELDSGGGCKGRATSVNPTQQKSLEN